MQKLCLENIPHDNKKITPDQVIQEFNRKPDRNNKCQLAIARFKEECCLRGLVLNGQQVTPDEVVKDFPDSLEGKLGIARFKVEWCLRGLALNGLQVTPDAVVKDFPDSPKGKLGKARFKAECCLRGLSLDGQQVLPDAVVKDFPDSSEGKLGMARFKAECCLRGLALNGQQVTPDAVVKDYQAARAILEQARFKAECCLRKLLLNGQQVTPDEVVKGYQAAKAILELARFKEHCCLMELPLNGQQVTPDAVVKDFPESPEGKRGKARFKAECCLRSLPLNGQQVTPDAVVKDYQAAKAILELARFKAECCLRGLALNGLQVTPDAVVKDFPDSPKGKLGKARFKAECCLRGLSLNGQQVLPDAVVKDFPDSSEGKLGMARFKAECCLRGLALNGQQVTPDAVVKDYQATNATLGLARFKAECCLRGLVLNGQQVTPDEVVKDFPESPEGKLGIAHFQDQCCLRGLALNGQQITTDAVVKDFPDSPEGKLGIARFKAECCLRGLALNGQQITTDAVVKGYPESPEGRLWIARFRQRCCLRGLALNGQRVTTDAVVKGYPQSPEGKLGIAHFKERCCLRGLALNGQQVTPDAVVKDYQAARAALDLARFKEQCCLRGLLLHGRQIIPDAVVKDYERGGWWLEKAIFYSQLVLNARALNSGYLDNQKVLAAFNDVPGDHSSRQAEYLMQRLKQPQRYDETDDARDIIQQAWRILNSVSIKNDEQRRLQCILKFMAMQYQLPIDHQSVSAEAVWQSITTLRRSFKNSRLPFFFLARCYITNQSVDGRPIHKNEVLECLQSFPEGSKLRHALSRWFEQCSAQSNIMDQLLFKPDNTVPGRGNDRSNSHSVHSVNSVKEKAESASVTRAATVNAAQNLTQALKPTLQTNTAFSPDQLVPQFNTLTLKALDIIQEINGGYTDPPIVITGSYARFLQHRCSSFNDIDIICATEVSARTLLDRLRALNTDEDAEIPKRILIWPMHGCQEIKLPKAYNIVLREGDFGTKAMGLQVSVDIRVTHGNLARLLVHVPGVERLVCCLPFAEETRLLNDTLKHLADNFVLLTEQLKQGRVLNIPRTIIFNLPNTTEERIYGLFIRSLLTLNKARQFIDLYSEGNPDDQPDQLREEQQQRLYALTEELQWTLRSHAYRDGFEQSVNRWLTTTAHVNDYEIKRKDFIKALLAMIHPE
ncbi:hypothetical protein [Endozoicomonas sp. SCSIO W0465]|uniref:hypothetical protein n=1 Tax=Endozoicomonas sp. SCSIO W0465 TaxID=2918516 RepID=UPI0020754350|nr:hypothetical protein [Endozoicomonas sp. SCSIO W0465]USE34537.1 hypothetical protein MJO57_20655 [Endozoicomonas sp. SCSIO W0465]